MAQKKRVYKCSILAEDQQEIQKFLSHPIFSKKIINPISNVGVISFEKLILQVMVISRNILKKEESIKRMSESSSAIFELGQQTISELCGHLVSLEHKLATA